MFATYVLLNENNNIYIGHTADLKLRLLRHNNKLPHKKTSYTYKRGLEWKLIYTEYFKSRKEARYRERQLKSYQGRQWLTQKLNISW